MVAAKKRPKKKAKKELVRLDLGCGQNKQATADGEPFTGIDISPDADADIVHDLNVYPWPLEDDSVTEAFCSHYVEHIPMVLPDGSDGLCAFMGELHRVMADGAQVRIVHPHCRSNRAFQDPTHRRFIPEETWAYFARDWREANKLDHYPIGCDFGVEQMFYTGFQNGWELRSEQSRQFALTHYWNVAIDLGVDLKARK